MKFDGKQVARIGFFTKSHGNLGELEFSPEQNSEQIIEDKWVLVDIQQELIPFYVLSVLPKGKKYVVKLKHINNIDKANNLSKKYVFSFASTKENIINGNLLIDDCIGYFVFDITSKKELGTLSNIYDEQANPLIEITGEKEILVPINGDFIQELNHAEKKIILQLPENYTDIY